MSQTQENLKAAFTGESQANRRYLAFAARAEADGKPGLAKLFRAAAEGETVHALNHLVASGEVKSTSENLIAAIAGETYEIDTMYPQFMKEASEDNADEATMLSFAKAEKVEEFHKAMFTDALFNLEKGQDAPDGDYFICPVCGYLVLAEIPERCPICATLRSRFYKA
jgi:rubrerythrin